LPELLTITINGREVQVKSGTVVSAALLTAGIPCRRSATGQLRTALCGMGICFECRATVDGVPHRRTCQLLCHSGMVVETR
jgi:predicted molibdopterin-dependent oxidoreductase YjgC